MSLNRDAYYTLPDKVKRSNKDIFKNINTKAAKKPPVKIKNNNKTK
jgi:hypothetical protein